MVAMGEEDWGGLPDPDPDLSKNRGGLPDPDPSLSKNRGGLPDLDLDSPRQISSKSRDKSRDKSRPNLDFPRLFSLKSGKFEAIPTLPDFWLKVGES